MTPAELTKRLDRATAEVEGGFAAALEEGARRMATAAVEGADRVLQRRTGALVDSIRAEASGRGAQLVAGGPSAPYLVVHEARLGFVRTAVEGEVDSVSRALSDVVGVPLGGDRYGE